MDVQHKQPEQTSPLCGVGMTLEPADPGRNGCCYVSLIKYGGAVQQSGRVKVGDQLVRIDGFDCVGQARKEIKRRVLGSPDTEIVLEFKRARDTFEVRLRRAPESYQIELPASAPESTRIWEAKMACGLLLLLFLASAWIVSEYEGAQTGPVAHPSTATNTLDTPAFTMDYAMRSKQHVQRLAAMGVKIVGSRQAEFTAPAYILSHLRKIKSASHDSIQVEISVQLPSGSFNTDFLGGINAVYDNVTNVLCRISSKHAADATKDAILIDTHFDTHMGSPGAADDLSQVAVALEVASLRALREP